MFDDDLMFNGDVVYFNISSLNKSWNNDVFNNDNMRICLNTSPFQHITSPFHAFNDDDLMKLW